MIFELQAKDIIDLDKKLNGELSVNKEELIALINSWGRNNWFYSIDQFNNKIKILKCEATQSEQAF